MQKHWNILKPDPEQVRELSRALGHHPAMALALINRGLTDEKAARAFIKPSLEQLGADIEICDMDLAVERAARAVFESEPIGIHGDFDVDGVSSTALLLDLFGGLEVPASSFIPNRMLHGYGMSESGVDTLIEQGARLIIAVDCGISDHQAIAHAKDRGIDVLVLDHHQAPAELPPALAIVDPHRADCPSKLTELSGVGLAFFFAMRLRTELRKQGYFNQHQEPNLKRLMDLAALGTVADVVPVTGMNRILVYYGLDQINRDGRLGLKMLKHSAGLGERTLGVGNLGFHLAPRLNAAGRMDDAEHSLGLLVSNDQQQARALAETLEKFNSTRRRVEERILAEALEQIESDRNFADARSAIVAGPDWHPGVIGIVASRLVEKFNRPAVVVSFSDGIGRGSLRSIPGFNLIQGLDRCSEFLVRYGGHRMAAGITVDRKKFQDFREHFDSAVSGLSKAGQTRPTLNVDAEWPLDRIDWDMARDLQQLSPFGIGNPEPCFCARGAIVKHARVGRSSTLMMTLQEGNVSIEAIGFRMGDACPEVGLPVDLVYVPEIDTYKGPEKLRIRLKDLRSAV